MSRTDLASTLPLPGAPAPRRSRSAIGWCAWSCGLGTGIAYLIGSSRSFDYDESVTIAHFVRTSSLLAPLTREVVFNNHVAFSVMEHLVYLVTGSASETTMRLLPVAFAAATVGLLVSMVARQTSIWIGIAAGALLATNPLFVATGREAHGYSLLCLCALASTSLLLSLLQAPTRTKSAGYIGLVALGLATHLYMVLVIAAHAVILARRRQLTTQWRQRLLASTLLGATPYLAILSTMAQAARSRPRRVQLAFPLDLARALLGHAWPAVLILALGTATIIWRLRTRRETPAIVVLYLAALASLWLVLAPYDLYPRFFVWACSAVAAAAAIGLTRLLARTLAVAAILTAATSMAFASVSNYTTNPLITRDIAPLAHQVQAQGGTVCGIGTSTETLAAYTPNIHQIPDATRLPQCDLAIVVDPNDDPNLVAAALQHYRHHRWVHAQITGVILWDRPNP